MREEDAQDDEHEFEDIDEVSGADAWYKCTSASSWMGVKVVMVVI